VRFVGSILLAVLGLAEMIHAAACEGLGGHYFLGWIVMIRGSLPSPATLALTSGRGR